MDMVQSEALEPVLRVLQQEAGVTKAEAKEIFITLFVFVHGYASLFANNEMTYDSGLLAAALKKVFSGAVYVVKEKAASDDSNS